MTIDKRINFRGGGMDMGNTKSQARSASMGNTSSRSRSTSSGTGGGSGNLGGGGGGQGSDSRSYSPPTRPTYTPANIDQKPITGDDYRRSQNEFIDNLNRNNAARFEPSFFNRTYNPLTMDQVGARNQLPDYSNIIKGGILGLLNPLAGMAYKGYNFLKDRGMESVNNMIPKISSTLDTFKDSPTLVDFYQNMQNVPVNDTIDIREKFDRSGILSEVRPVQTFEFDSSQMESPALPAGQGGLTIAELQGLIDNATATQDLNQIGEGADFVSYEPSPGNPPKLGDNLDLLRVEANRRALERYFEG
tara:strand:+ start:472 stop:1383 length:912 start_codon:yes stop_codon:yes gene_type:complete